MRSLGHNLGVGHSGEDGREYWDNSGYMGSSWSSSDWPRMCYNAAKSWQLGWYSDKAVELSPFPMAAVSWSGALVRIVEYNITSESDPILVKIKTGTSNDYYVNFNRQTGINSETQEGGDQVLAIKQGGNGVEYSNSQLVMKSGVQTVNLVDSEGAYSRSFQVVISQINTGVTPAFANVAITGGIEHGLIYLNCGDEYDDGKNIWIPDDGFVNTGIKDTTDSNISNTELDTLYQTDRYYRADSPVDMKYTIPLVEGYYDIVLHFSEHYSGCFDENTRVFNVTLDGSVVFSDIDIWAEVGAYSAMQKTAPSFLVTDGTLDIGFGRIKENPKINAIEIVSLATRMPSSEPSAAPSSLPTVSSAPSASVMPSNEPSTAMTDYFVNCGGQEYNDGQNVWVADMVGSEHLYHDAGSPYSEDVNIIGTSHQALYQTERYGAMTWTFPVPPGDYGVSLHFAEIWNDIWKEAAEPVGVRFFNVAIEGITVLENFDVFDVAGNLRACVETFETTVSDNTLTIEFIKIPNKNNPKINAIEIHRLPDPSTVPSDTPSASAEPTFLPSQVPSDSPTKSAKPSSEPSEDPTKSPSPSLEPSVMPTTQPSAVGSNTPSLSFDPAIAMPSNEPSWNPSEVASAEPSLSSAPSKEGSNEPSRSIAPSSVPSDEPSFLPSDVPSRGPSGEPSTQPSLSAEPSDSPSTKPSLSLEPSGVPSVEPSISTDPSLSPSVEPTLFPSQVPSDSPTKSAKPSSEPSEDPTKSPSPSQEPSATTSTAPTKFPTTQPSAVPTSGDVCIGKDKPECKELKKEGCKWDKKSGNVCVNKNTRRIRGL